MLSLSRPDRVLLAALAVAAVIFVGLEYVSRPTLESLTVEDGPVEYLTALSFFVAGCMFIAAAVRRYVARIWGVLLGVGFIFVAGEEISWGQRLLGVSTPESIAAANVQAELNLHNLEGVNDVIRGAGTLVLLAAFVAFPIAVARLRWARHLAERWHIPVPPMTVIPIALIGLLFMVVPRLAEGGAVFRLDEVGEIYVALVPLVFAVHAWRTPDRDREPVTAQ